MKGHAVPWDFIPKEIQALLGVAVLVLAWIKMYPNMSLIRRWWPVATGVTNVLMVPLFVAWAGFGPTGIMAKSLAAEIQSSFPGPLVSSLQSVGSKGLGLKSTGVFFGFGWTLGRVAFEGLLKLGWIPMLAIEQGQNQQQQQPAQPPEALGAPQQNAEDVHRRSHDD